MLLEKVILQNEQECLQYFNSVYTFHYEFLEELSISFDHFQWKGLEFSYFNNKKRYLFILNLNKSGA